MAPAFRPVIMWESAQRKGWRLCNRPPERDNHPGEYISGRFYEKIQGKNNTLLKNYVLSMLLISLFFRAGEHWYNHQVISLNLQGFANLYYILSNV
jgi:hypothetical protein